ncbi:MAG: tetratricopeptide repeat protein [bacterium]
MKRFIFTLTALAMLLPAAADAQIENAEAAEKFNNGRSLYQQGKYQDALEDFLESAKLEPGNYLAHYMAGLTYNRLRQPDEAKTQFEAAVKHNPNYFRAFFALGRVHESEGDLDAAVEAYQRSGQVSEEVGQPYPNAFFNLGAVLMEQQEWDQALQAYSKVIQHEPANERAYDYMGNIYEQKGEYTNALVQYKQAVKAKPAWHEPYFHQAVVLNKMGQYEEAINMADQALERMPGDGGSLFEKGTALKSLEKWDEAISVFREAAKSPQWKQLAEYQIERIQNRDVEVIPPVR